MISGSRSSRSRTSPAAGGSRSSAVPGLADRRARIRRARSSLHTSALSRDRASGFSPRRSLNPRAGRKVGVMRLRRAGIVVAAGAAARARRRRRVGCSPANDSPGGVAVPRRSAGHGAAPAPRRRHRAARSCSRAATATSPWRSPRGGPGATSGSRRRCVAPDGTGLRGLRVRFAVDGTAPPPRARAAPAATRRPRAVRRGRSVSSIDAERRRAGALDRRLRAARALAGLRAAAAARRRAGVPLAAQRRLPRAALERRRRSRSTRSGGARRPTASAIARPRATPAS